jgi:hypothetical protein
LKNQAVAAKNLLPSANHPSPHQLLPWRFSVAKSRAELFAQSLIRRRLERRAREWIKKFASGFSVEDLRYAAEHNLDIISTLLKPGEQRSRRKKAAPFKHLVDGVTADDLIRLFDQVSPEHASVLRQYKQWFIWQVEIARQDVFGNGD